MGGGELCCILMHSTERWEVLTEKKKMVNGYLFSREHTKGDFMSWVSFGLFDFRALEKME